MKNCWIVIFALFFASATSGRAQRYVKTYNTLDEAWAANLNDVHTNIFISGRSAANDGGGGMFWYEKNATTTTNKGMVFGNKFGGRIFRVWNGEPIPIPWFGAVPTKLVGASLTPAGSFDNSVPINNAIAWARTPTYGPADVRAAVSIPAGDWWISKSITNRYRVDVIGLGCVFADNEFTSHSVSSSGMVSGASRIRLADAADCPMMVWDLSDASQRYTFAYTDDGITMTSTVTIASPGVITATAHGLTVGRRVGFTTTGTLPTGITALTIYYVQSVPTADTLTIAATSGGAVINTSGSQSGTHTLIKDPTPKFVGGNTIKGINFFGNSANQTRYDCNILEVRYAWNIRIENCNFGNPSGYMILAHDCNTLDIVDCYGNGGGVKNKGVFLFSNADGFMSQCKFGGCSGPALWICSANGWQQQYNNNFLYNNFNGQWTVSGIASDEVTFTTNHDFETGQPIEFAIGSGGALPTLTRYGSIATDSHIFWAIKTSTNKVKVAFSYEDAMAGSALGISGGSGLFYVWRGPGAGAYLSGGANKNILLANRCDQNQNFGIALNKATENSILANLLNLNGFNSLTASSEPTTSAGLYFCNGSSKNVAIGNSMGDLGVYAQTYGIWQDSNCGKNYIGQNSYNANAAMVDTLLSSTGNTTETPVIQLPSGVTITTDSTGIPLTFTRSGTLNQWQFELSSATNILRVKNSYNATTGLNLSSPITDVSLTLGSTGAFVAPRNSLLYGESAASAALLTDANSPDFYVVVGAGTGASTSGGKFRIYTPDVGTTGTTTQSTTEKFAVMRQGGVILKTLTAAPTLGIADGAIYANSADKLFYGRHASAWQTMSTPNIIGLSTVVNDANATFTFFPLVSRWNQLLNVPITATRTVTLSTSFAQQGTQATFTRTSASTGAFNWSIGGLINLTPGSWCTVEYDGSAWVLNRFYSPAGGGDALVANPLSQFAATTSVQLAGVISDETGTGAAVFGNSPTLTTPVLGVATATSINKVALTAPATGSTITITDGKTFASQNTLTLAGTDGSTLNVGTGGTLGTAAFTASSAYQAVDTDLTAVAGLATTGLISRTGAGTASTRTITAPAAGITVSNGDGVSGNPTLALANDLSALEGLASTGIARRTGTDAWSVGTTVSVAEGGTGATTASAALDALNVAETTIASATTTSIGGVASDKVSITGTTTITSFGTVAAGIHRIGRFTGALTLTHNATSLILPGGASITTAAGDAFEAVSLGTGNWAIYFYQKANGQAVVSSGGGSGTKTIRVFSPNDNEPPSSNYATLVYRNNHPTLAFDTTAQETAVFRGMIPEGTVLTSGLTVYVQWAAETATTGTIGWDAAFERVDAGGLDIDADNFGTAQTITAATVNGTSGITSKTSVNFSQAQLPTSLAVGDQYRLRIRRDVANDNASGDAQLLQVEVRLQ